MKVSKGDTPITKSGRTMSPCPSVGPTARGLKALYKWLIDEALIETQGNEYLHGVVESISKTKMLSPCDIEDLNDILFTNF